MKTSVLLTNLWDTLTSPFAPHGWGWRLIGVAIIIVAAFLVSWILRIVIRHVVDRIVNGVKKTHRVDDTQALAASPVATVRVVQRTRTLGSVLTNIINVVVTVVAVLLAVNTINPEILGSFAILTAALGAGLGFGAQNIVKDVLNGLFMVVEDQLGVGDVVDVGPATGVVEAVGIRITQVRDVNGTLWFVRNGEILRVGNMSQGWARVIVDVSIPYEADVDAVQSSMLEAANALVATPKWRARVIEKPEMWGMESISADAMVIRVVLKTRTNAKDDVARELRMRLKRAIDDMQLRPPALNTVVLTGYEGATSVSGARPPRTNPVKVVPPAKKARGRAARNPRGTTADPRSISVVPRGERPPRGDDK